jgi:predicted amidophosphoribosyltransferase
MRCPECDSELTWWRKFGYVCDNCGYTEQDPIGYEEDE